MFCRPPDQETNLGGLFSAGAIHKTNGTALPFRAIPLDSHRVERMFSARFCGIGEIILATLNKKNPFWYEVAPFAMKGHSLGLKLEFGQQNDGCQD